ncbi:MAG: hypothetical protein N2109_04955 [Fimbriimonadales bacterium]|nr:hypothetical protein [Fimbriimonadales bacterium]
MKGWGGFLTAAALLAVAAALQGVATRLAVLGASADYPLTVACTLALFGRPAGGAVLGFAAGFLHGCVVGANLGYLAFSRTLAGYASSASRSLEVRLSPLVAALTVAVCTIGAEALELLLPPAKPLLGSLGDTIGTATYNGVLAIPLYALLSRFLRPARP